MLVDTGASVDIIDEKTWQQLSLPGGLKPAQINLMPYGKTEKLQVLGQLSATLECNKLIKDSTVYVVSGSFRCVLGYTSSHALGIVNLNAVSSMPESLTAEKIIHKFPELFQGISKLKDVSVKLHIDESVQPIAQPHRRVPFHLWEKVEQKLKDLENDDIIEKIDDPTPWVSPIITPPKPNSPTEIRLCVDMRGPNKAILRERHITPTI